MGNKAKNGGESRTVFRAFSGGIVGQNGGRGGESVDHGQGRGFRSRVSGRALVFALLGLSASLPLAAQEAVRGFVSVEPFEVRLEALVKIPAYRESWRLEGDTIGPAAKQVVLDNLLTLFESGVTVTSPGTGFDFSERTARFIVPDAEKGFVPDEREAIPVDEALVGLTLSSASRGVTSLEIEWIWFAPGQERLVLEIASRGKPSARLLTPAENRASWKLDGETALPSLLEVPDLVRREHRPLRSLVFPGFAMVAAAAWVVLRKKTKSPAWVGWLLVGGIGTCVFALRHRTIETALPEGAAVEDLVYALLRNTYHAFDFRDESAIYDTLAASVTGPLLERVYLEMRSSLELENAGGPRVRVHEIALRQCQDLPENPADPGGFKTRAEWVTIGEVTHWGHTHERTNRYEADVTLAADGESWKISGLDLLNEERVQKTTRRTIEPEPARPAP